MNSVSSVAAAETEDARQSDGEDKRDSDDIGEGGLYSSGVHDDGMINSNTGKTFLQHENISRTDCVNFDVGGGISEDACTSDKVTQSPSDWQWHEDLLRAIYRNLRLLNILKHTDKGVDKPLKDEGQDDVVYKADKDSVQSINELTDDEEVLNFENAVYRYWREADVHAVDPSRCLMTFMCIGDDALLGSNEGIDLDGKAKEDFVGKELAPEGCYGATQKRATVFRRVRELAMDENTSLRIRRIKTQLCGAWTYIGTQAEDEVTIAKHKDDSLLLPGPVMWHGACSEGIMKAMPWARETCCFAQILQSRLVSEETLRRCFVRAQLLQQAVRMGSNFGKTGRL